MNSIAILTQSSGILKPIAIGLGYLMNGIYVLLGNLFNVHNVALTIIVFTIVIYLFLMPLTYQQQKFSKMTMIMNPELKAIQKKYQGKRDQNSVNAMNEETRAVYKKYGVSPSGSCIYLVIQLPILFALYRVIYNVPAYISSIRNSFTDLVNGIMGTSGYQNLMTNFFDSIKKGNYVYRGVSLDFETTESARNSIIDVLYKCTNANWSQLADTFPNLTDVIQSTQSHIDTVNNFLGVSVVYAPRVIIGQAFQNHTPLFILLGILIPVISAGTQLLNIRLMPQPSTGMEGANQMKVMNYMMPIYSFILVFFLPVGVGVYWIAGALIRCFQQFVINKHMDKIDMEALIKKNREKAEAKEKKRIEKKGVQGKEIARNASISTKSLNTGNTQKRSSMASKANSVNSRGKSSSGGSAGSSSAGSSSAGGSTQKYKKNSMAAKANMIRDFSNSGSSQSSSKNSKASSQKNSGQSSSKNNASSSSKNNTSGSSGKNSSRSGGSSSKKKK